MAVLKKKHAAENQQTATVQAPTPAAQSADGSTQAEQDLVAIYTLIDQGKISDANKQFALKKEFLRRYCVPEAFDALRQAIEGTNKPTAAPAESADQIAVDIYNIIDKGDMGKARTLFAANRDLLKASLIKEAYDALLQTLK